jgi:hypothetical protein
MKIEFKGRNNPRLNNGDFGFDWCDKCGSQQSALVVIERINDTFRLCKTCLTEAIDIIDKTILKDAIDKGKILHGR